MYMILLNMSIISLFLTNITENGKWSEWTDWDLCSKTCAGGITMRRRRCDSPPPDPEGQPCNGADTETKSCNPEKCPGMKYIL